jgi:DNA-binding transcriptional regulator YiaG
LSIDAVKEWEMGRRKPERATRVLLKVIDREPEAVTYSGYMNMECGDWIF